MFINKVIYIFEVLQRSNHTKQNIMATINLKTISNKNFESIIQNLIGTNCEMEFSNYTEKGE